MARLRDVPVVLRTVGPWTFLKRVYTQMSEDNLLAWAAALAYSWLFAVFPFLIFVLALVPYLPTEMKDSAEEGIRTFVTEYVPQQANLWANIRDNIQNLLHQPRGPLLYVGLAAAIWAASGGMAMTMSAMDRCYELQNFRPWWKQRGLAFLLTICAGFLILFVVLLLPVGTFVKNWVTSPRYNLISPDNPLLIVFNITRWALSLLFMVMLSMLVYHFGPAVKHRFRWITPGAVFSITVWIILGLGFRFYIEKYGNYEKTYGTVGGVAILLLLFYIDAVVLLLGAEINSEIDFEVLKIRRGTNDFRPAEAKTSSEENAKTQRSEETRRSE